MRAKASKAAGRPVDAQARREDDGRARGRARRPTRSRGSSSPRRRRAARPRSRRRSCRSPTARSRSSPTSTSPSTRARRVVILGLNGAGKTTMLRILAGVDTARHRRGHRPGTASSSATTPRSTRPSTPSRTVLENMQSAAPQLTDTEARSVLGLVPLLRRRRPQVRRGALRRREDPARAGQPGRLQRQRAAARRAHQQPRPRLPRGGAGRDPHLRGRDHPGHPRRGRRRAPSSRTGCCCCPTATRTSGTTTTPTWSRWPERSAACPEMLAGHDS